ncbi:ABC transporter ATP-binding protein [Corynebacterium matruchotii]|uniref:ABC transporter, ATP-binding protein n=1 Tax=Corynebacterium matruchotii ATCC 33806 TaxID=566549 RepID=C0E692_9CORY|nr:ABC transporter ATP-binding protein [Corynebacterium matruchotii]EEG25933.1 ABC transporter, ATP-binding protein [Corynebacterium matruchotii ATCC 33806]
MLEPGVKKLIAPARKSMITTAIITSIGGTCAIVPYIAITEIAANWFRGSPNGTLWLWVGVAIVAVFANGLLYGIGLGVTHISEANLRYQLRRRLVQAFGQIPLGRVDQTSSGSIRKMVCDDTAAIHTLVAHLAGDAMNAVTALVVGIGYLLWVDWQLTLLILGVWVVIFVVVTGTMMRGFSESTSKFSSAKTELSAATVEMVEGIKEIKNFQAAATARTRFDKARRYFADISYQWLAGSGKPMAIISSFFQPAVILVTIAPLTVWFVSKGWLEPAYALPFFMVGVGLPVGFLQFVQIMQHLFTANQAAQDTADLLDIPHQPDGPHTDGPGPKPGEVELTDVSFGYNPENPILRNVNLLIPAGSVTALVGPSGGGKTTIARLIARFYDVDAGAVKVDGLDVREVSNQWLLNQIAIVFQDIALAHDTVANNIALGNPQASRDEIVGAAKSACIHDRIMRLPHGYDTVIGGDGGFLSGGEKQRITIARAYLHNAPILILDEATAQTDPQSERDIHTALAALAKGKTVIIIAHRLATIAAADLIAVIGEPTASTSETSVLATGTHAELLERSETYRTMWEKQQEVAK